jgi:hypothetical protein
MKRIQALFLCFQNLVLLSFDFCHLQFDSMLLLLLRVVFCFVHLCLLLGYCHLYGSSPTLGEGCHCQEPAAGVAPTMCTHPRCQRLVATIIQEVLELAATFVEEELELVAPFLPINRHQESIAN